MIVYRAFFETGVFWLAGHACRALLGADAGPDLAAFERRARTLAVPPSRAPQPDLERLKP